MKVNTIEQFKILEFLKENFYIEELKLKLIDRYTIEIEDVKGEKMQFKYKNGKVIY